MKFNCDKCSAQYMISDDKVGAAGVRVRCKKCQNVVLVRRPEIEAPPPEDSTVVMTAEKLAQMSAQGFGMPNAAVGPPKVTADEIGQAFNSMFPDTTEAAAPTAAPPGP
ncbi:MAG: MJ0042-type zinc finger domain-containing protein, partial [Deltaproteobacteria bacterium]